MFNTLTGQIVLFFDIPNGGTFLSFEGGFGFERNQKSL